jgi:hypothetical protein
MDAEFPLYPNDTLEVDRRTWLKRSLYKCPISVLNRTSANILDRVIFRLALNVLVIRQVVPCHGMHKMDLPLFIVKNGF